VSVRPLTAQAPIREVCVLGALSGEALPVDRPPGRGARRPRAGARRLFAWEGRRLAAWRQGRAPSGNVGDRRGAGADGAFGVGPHRPRSLFRARKGMAARAQTPVLPEANHVGPLSAQSGPSLRLAGKRGAPDAGIACGQSITLTWRPRVLRGGPITRDGEVPVRRGQGW
jgi:hypothetical protein